MAENFMWVLNKIEKIKNNKIESCDSILLFCDKGVYFFHEA